MNNVGVSLDGDGFLILFVGFLRGLKPLSGLGGGAVDCQYMRTVLP